MILPGMARSGRVWRVGAWQSGLGQARHGTAGRGPAVSARLGSARQVVGVSWLGSAGAARPGRSWRVSAWQGSLGSVWRVTSRQGMACLGSYGEARRGESRQGRARLGRRGPARRVWARSGSARQSWQGLFWRVSARLVAARFGSQGPARLGAARQMHGTAVKARHGTAGRRMARQSRLGTAWRGRARRGRARHGRQTIIYRKEQHAVSTVASKNGREANAAELHISRIARETLVVPILGITPLIVHRFSEKAKRQMLDAMQGRKSPKQAKDPQAEYEAAFYRLNDGRPGMIAGAFKDATVGGARFYHAVKMTEIKSFLWFLGELGNDGRMMVPIDGEPEMREDVVRVGRGGTDLRYRPQFTVWKTTLTITYPTSSLTRESVLSLVDAGGMGVGVGEWRPQKGGEFGTYCVDPDREVEVIE